MKRYFDNLEVGKTYRICSRKSFNPSVHWDLIVKLMRKLDVGMTAGNDIAEVFVLKNLEEERKWSWDENSSVRLQFDLWDWKELSEMEVLAYVM